MPADVDRFVSQPLPALPSQLPHDVSHVAPHVAAVHVRTTWGAVGHARPHAPQWSGFVCVLTQLPTDAQYVVPVGHTLTQVPPEHEVPAAHARPHAPQFALVVRGVSQPFDAAPSQLPKPALHAPTAHAPPAHAGVALGVAHAAPHAPQLVAVVVRAVSQPFAATPSQSPKPPAQAPTAHAPDAHVAAAWASAQATPQRPQFAALVVRFTSQPFAAPASQSP